MSLVTEDTTSVPVGVLLRGRGRKVPPKRAKALLLGACGVVSLLLLWELVTRLGLVGASSLPPASSAFKAAALLLSTSTFWAALSQTILSALLGILISIAIAVPLGTLIGLNGWLHRLLYATIEFLKPIPVVALLPLALLMFGATMQTKLGLIVFGTVWPLLIQVIYGIRSVDMVAWNTAKSFRISVLRRFGGVVLPSAAPSIATGLRVSAVTALLLSVVTELVGAVPGLGYEIRQSQSATRFDDLYAYVIITGLLGVGLNLLLEYLERRLVFWQADQREVRR